MFGIDKQPTKWVIDTLGVIVTHPYDGAITTQEIFSIWKAQPIEHAY